MHLLINGSLYGLHEGCDTLIQLQPNEV